MRVLHVTPTYAPAIGGIEDVVANLARYGRNVGLEADVAHVRPGLPRGRWMDGAVPVFTRPLFGHRMLGWAPGLATLAAGYDLLHVHDPQVGALTMNVGGQAGGVPAVLSTHGGFFHTGSAARLKRFHAQHSAQRMLRRYTRVLASSRSDLDAFRALSGNVVLVENGVDTGKLAAPAAGPRGLSRWIYFGRFARNKRIDALIALVASLAREGVTVTLAICGSDFDGILPELRAQVAAAGLEQRIRFDLSPDQAALRERVAGSGLFVTASEYEGFGLSVIEAMAAGLIPACRDVPPLDRLVGDTGLFLRFDGGPDDVAAVRAMLAMGPAAIADRAAAATRRAAAFDWSTKIADFISQYDAVLANAAEGRGAAAVRV